MSTPVDPAADAAIRDQLADQAAKVTGTPSAGVYGDVAGAERPPQQMDLSAAKAVVTDAEALLKRIQELEARQQAAEDAANPPPAPPDTSLHMDANAPGYLHAFKDKVEDRLALIEEKLGI
jgi:hypothetical protein